MSRKITGKIIVIGELIAETPLSIGGVNNGMGADLELALNGKGKYYIPGSSLMGPLRHWLEINLQDGCLLAKAMLGYQERDRGHASYLLVEDAEVELPDNLTREVRDGIQISRWTGTAREHYYYTRAILPRGTRIPLRLELDLPTNPVLINKKNSPKCTFDACDFQGALRLLMKEICEKGIRLGGAKTRGFGLVKFQQNVPNIQCFDFAKQEHLDAWLDRKDIETTALDAFAIDKKLELKDNNRLDITIDWEPISPLMVKAGRDGNLADMMPLVSGFGKDEVAPVIPGSTLKGIFRSHAAKIIRTLLPDGHPALIQNDQNPNPDPQIPIIADLFGCTDKNGRVTVDDVYQHDNRINAKKWVAEDKEALDNATVHENHVAIDRFTGGASQGALYSARPPRNDKDWDSIRIHLDFTRPVESTISSNAKKRIYSPVSEELLNAETALLLLVLRDISAGLVPIGFSTRRGMGDIRVSEVGLEGRLCGKEVKRQLDEVFEDNECVSQLNKHWNTAITNLFKIEAKHEDISHER